MKRIVFSLLTLSITCFSAVAQDSTNKVTRQDMRAVKADMKQDKQHRKENMKALNLSDDQKKELKENREAYKSKLRSIENNKQLSETQKSEQKAALKSSQKSNMQALLTQEQKTTLTEQKVKQKSENKQQAEKKAADMKTALALTDEQATQMRALEVSNHQKIKAIRKDKSLDEAAKQKQVDEIKRVSAERKKTILTPEQLKKMDELKKTDNSPGQRKGKRIAS